MNKVFTSLFFFIIVCSSLAFPSQGKVSENSYLIKTLALTSPNGGENWQTGSSKVITWNSTGINEIRIEYSTNNGGSWGIASSSVTASLGIFNWNIPSSLSSSQALIRIYDLEETTLGDTSDLVFQLSRLEISAPSSGQKLLVGASQSITWTASAHIANVKLEYTSDNGTTWNTISASVPAIPATYSWVVPNTPSTQMAIRISDAAVPAIFNTSSNFTIAAISLTQPNGFENLLAGTSTSISWTSTNIDDIKIEYSSNNGSSWSIVTSSTNASNGTYSWTVPSNGTFAGKIRISDATTPGIADVSDNSFNIYTLKLTSPNTATAYEIGSLQSVTWNSNLSGNIRIDISSDNGSTWSVLEASVAASAGTYAFTVPNSPTSQGRIRLVSLSDANLYDVSDAAFVIGSVTLTAPVGGETFQAGSTATITWTSSGSSLIKIEVSSNNGTSWNTITSSTSASTGSFLWNISSAFSSTQTLIRISDVNGGLNISSTSGIFTVSRLFVTSPSSGEVLRAGSTKNITWTASADLISLKIEYSLDDGANWSTISNNADAATGSYSWSVPDLGNTTQGRIRLTDNSNTSIVSSSAPFRIGYLNLVAPVGGEKLFGGSTFNIQWSNSSSVSFVKIEYSTNGGTNWLTINSATSATPGSYSWNVPRVATNNALVRLGDAFGTAVSDTSDAVFSIASLAVTSPNGAEGLSIGSTQNITWTATMVNQVNIQYSTNGGGTWINISNNVSAVVGTYSWVVPNTPTSQALVRVVDAENSTFSDQSDAVFKIASLTLTSPNGGERLFAGSTKAITWTNSVNITSINIEYSTNNGSNWINISSGVNSATGTYNWTVANTAGSATLVRITDAANSAFLDASDAVFDIKSLQVTYPNGGEFLQADSIRNITWTAGNVANVKIEFSSNNGVSWSTIVNSTPAAALTYAWTIPDNYTSNGKIKISDADFPTENLSDESNSVFSISTLRLISPNGGESLTANSLVPITWNSAASIANLRIEYSTNNGTSFSTVISSTPAGPKLYNWTVPSIVSSQVKIRIADASNSFVADTSDAVFSIRSIQLTSPNGGEFYQAGAIKNITWLNISSVSNVALDYSTNNGTSWNLITASTDASAQTYAWTVPNTPSSSALVRVRDAADQNVNDVSNGVFTIQSVQVVTPNGGEILQAGKGYSVKWNSSNITTVNIDYSSDNGSSWNSVATSVNASTGTYLWTVPNIITTQAIIRVSSAVTASTNDLSDNVFSITSLDLTAPAGTSGLLVGSTMNITWTSSGISNVKLEYTTNSGTSWNTISASIAAAAGTYSWTVPNTPSNSVYVKVSNVAEPLVSDSSSLLSIGSITLSSPSAGEFVQSGSQKLIQWTASSNIQNVKLEYTSNGGTNWNVITNSTGASAGSFTWSVPGSLNVTNARVRITSTAASSIIDSTSFFTISTFQLNAPNGPAYLTAGTTTNITWAAGLVPNVKLEYTTDNGTSWSTIVASTAAAAGTYAWVIPPTLSTSLAKIRISDATNASVSDQSDNTFRIGWIQQTAPVLGAILQSGTSAAITWTNSNSISTLRLDYSTNNGTSWVLISNTVVASSGSYTWSIPSSLSSATSKIRLSDAESTLGIQSISNAFTLMNLDLGAPNGGEKLRSNSTYNITWSASNLISNVKLEYSTDNGSNWNLITSSTAAATGSYAWNIPSGLSSSQGRVRISDASNSAIRDSSSSQFSFSVLALTAPVGGEHMQSGTTFGITWNSANITSLKLEYSTNNGSQWTSIDNSVLAGSGSYNWTVPAGLATSTAKIRISDAGNSLVADSSSTFKISNLALTSPNGGEQYQAGSTQNITWTSGNITNVKLEYSSDAGTGWSTIISSTIAAAGTYSWAIPAGLASSQMLVRISDATNSAIKDSSNSTFTVSNLVLTSLTGGQQLQAGKVQNINWTANNGISNISIEYSTNSGTSWNTVVASVPASAGTYAWTVPSNISGTTNRIKITNLANAAITSQGGDFTVSILTLSSPLGGEVIQGGTSRNITWTSSAVTNLKIEYSSDNGTNWNTIVTSTPAAAGSYSWNIPSNLSVSNGIIRISDASNILIKDSSASSFLVGNITVTAPNGGELIKAGTNYSITWTNTASIQNVKLEYSTDNGTSWTSIINTTSAAPGTYSWAVPAGISNANMRVRISDAASVLQIADQSDNTFTVSTVLLTSPNGGEYLQVGSTKQITWTNGAAISNLRLDYSIDNGSNWILIANNVAAGSGTYSWTVPNNPSSLALIKISDASNTNIFDISDTTFKIGTITVTSPNGGEIWQVGRTQNITWTRSNNINLVDLFYSTDSGTSWNTVAANISAAAGSYAWTLPDAVSTTAKIRISDSNSSLAIADISNADYTITKLEVTSPVQGENLAGGSTKAIQWVRSNDIASINISYSTDNGATYTSIVSNQNAATGTYNWVIPTGVNTNNAKVLIVNSLNSSITDTSDRFSIYYPSLSVTSPNGSEFFQAGKVYPITWSSSLVTNVKLEYSVDNGSTWRTIVPSTSATSGTYNWLVDDTVSTISAKIKITDASIPTVSDVTDGVFKIGRVDIVVPNGGENLLAGGTRNITWTNSSSISNVRLDYSTDNGTTWNLIISSTPANTGSFLWNVPLLFTTQAKVRISDAASSFAISDISESAFTISTISITSPNGSEEFQSGNTAQITWTNSASISSVRLQYSTDNGTSWNNIVSSTPASAGTYSWQIGADVYTAQGLVRVTDANDTLLSDASNAVFKIKRLRVTSPNGNENYQAGSVQNITWLSNVIGSLRLEYSADNGLTWNLISNSVSAASGSYSWIVPSVATSQAKIRIADSSNTLVTDISDNTFQIGTLSVVSPNGGEEYQAGKSYSISWTSSSSIPNVKLDYSTDGGSTWNIIVASTPSASGSYTWQIPSTISTSLGRIRVSDATLATLADTSNNNFTIKLLDLTFPNGSNYLQTGTTRNITWNSSQIANVSLEYSVDNGSNWFSIITSTPANTGSYAWSVPALSGTQMKIRIKDVINQFIVDSSSQAFKIGNLTVLTPNGSERWQAGSQHSITWNATSSISNVDLYYSTDNGTNWLNIISGLSVSPGSYNWTVPQTTSTAVIIKIVDAASNLEIRDSSDAVLTISNLAITSPSGGETWSGGSNRQISWNSGSDVSLVDIDYSTDNGASWTSIITNQNAASGSYTWAVPRTVNTDSARIRISDPALNSISDTSGLFTIVYARLAALSPNGGEIWQAGTTKNITWTSTLVNNIMIEYSSDNGSSWNTVIGSTAASAGSYSWSIPDSFASSQSLIKLTDTSDSLVTDRSNNVFTIQRIVVASPNGNNYYNAGNTYQIQWQSSSNVSTVNIEYSTNGGTNWILLSTGVTASLGSYSWQVPSNLSTTSGKVRISSTSNQTIFDTSDSYFTSGFIQLLAPNGGTNYQANKTINVTWNSSASVGTVRIDYTSDNETTWHNAANNIINTGNYNWVVPSDLASNSVKIRVSDALSGLVIVDKSDTTFAIIKLTLTYPTAGANWMAGSSQPIRWTNSAGIINVNLELSKNNGLSWDTIRTNLSASDSVYYWNIPLTIASTQCRIRILNSQFQNIIDTSGVFKIFIPTLVLTSPNGGEYLQAGTTKRITWNSTFIPVVSLEYSLNNGANWSLINPAVLADSGYFDWTISEGISTSSARIKITDLNNPNLKDSSDNQFNIRWVTVESPNGGEVVQAGKTTTVRWSNSSNVSLINIDYTADSVWTSVASNIPAANGTYTWTIPTIGSNTAKIRISDAASGQQITDVSDANFTISLIRVTSPNGGEYLHSGDTTRIRWTTSSDISTIDVDVSYDNGGTWLNILSGINSSGQSALWTVPQSAASDSVLLRISDASNPFVYDITDNTFRLSSIQLVTPNGGEKLLVGSQYTVRWNAGTNLRLIDLHYSTNGGSIWIPIQGAQAINASASSFSWIIPDTPADSVFLRIRNAENTSFSDVSNTKLTISKLQILAPNGGQLVFAGSAVSITWLSSFVSNIAIEYTTNNGLDWNTISSSFPADSGRYSWQTAADVGISNKNYKVRLRDLTTLTIADTSNTTFTVSYIQLVSPNGAFNQTLGTLHQIRWIHSDSTISNVKLEYTTNRGISWITITESASALGGAYNWTIPNTPTATGQVRISDASNPSISDKSDSTFVISSIKITFPNGGPNQRVQAGKTFTISWQSGFISSVKLEYSINGGQDWNLMPGGSSVSAASGTFAWSVVNIPSENCLIKISDAATPNIYDISDTTFKISDIRVTSPNTLDAKELNGQTNITWQAFHMDSLRILYSTDGGNSFPLVVGSVDADSQRYSWTIPNIKTTTGRIRIVDKNDLLIYDDSDTNFVVIEFPKISSVYSFQKDTARILFSLSTPTEVVNLTRLEYETASGVNDVTNALVGTYSNITGPVVDTIYWNTLGSLNDFEGKVTLKATLTSNFNVTYNLQIDSFGVDNKAPLLTISSIQTLQDPLKYGWGNMSVSFDRATDINSPILYNIFTTDSLVFNTLANSRIYGDSTIVSNIKTSSNYLVRVQAVDPLGNSRSYDVSFKSTAAGDFNTDNAIDILDLVTFAKFWTSSDSTGAADMAPYVDTIPKITIRRNQRLDMEDMFVFVNMWNYYQTNRSLPKKGREASFNSAAERRQLNVIKNSEQLSVPIDLKRAEDITAVSCEILYDPSKLRFDSLTIAGSFNQPVVLKSLDSISGRIIVDIAELAGNIVPQFVLKARISANKGPNGITDSILVNIRAINKDLKESYSNSIVYSVKEIPVTYQLYQNYPNPFNPYTTIRYDLPENTRVTLTLFDILGQRVATLVNEEQTVGSYSYVLDMQSANLSLPSGVYLYQIRTGNYTMTKKLMLIK